MTDQGDTDDFDEEKVGFPTRKELFRHAESNPGIHFSQLKRDLEMETGLLQYRLRELERYDVLESEEYQGKRRVFVAQELDDEERTVLAVLRYETTRQILLSLLEEGPTRNRELAEAVGVTPATISWHISNLVEEGIVESVTEGRTTRYEAQNEDLVVQLLVRYRESFVDRAMDRIIDFWG